MSAPEKGQIRMNAFTDIEKARFYSTAIEDTLAKHLGVTVAKARKKIAGQIGVSTETLRNIRKERTKIVPSGLMDKIRRKFITTLEDEIKRLEHAVSIARQIGTHHSDHDLQAAQTHLVAAKEILEGAK